MHPDPPVRPYPGAGGPAGHRGNGPFMGGLVLARPMSAEAIEELLSVEPAPAVAGELSAAALS